MRAGCQVHLSVGVLIIIPGAGIGEFYFPQLAIRNLSVDLHGTSGFLPLFIALGIVEYQLIPTILRHGKIPYHSLTDRLPGVSVHRCHPFEIGMIGRYGSAVIRFAADSGIVLNRIVLALDDQGLTTVVLTVMHSLIGFIGRNFRNLYHPDLFNNDLAVIGQYGELLLSGREMENGSSAIGRGVRTDIIRHIPGKGHLCRGHFIAIAVQIIVLGLILPQAVHLGTDRLDTLPFR